MLRLCAILFAGLAACGAALDAQVRAESREGWRRLQNGVSVDLVSGSLPRLQRAQLITTRALMARPEGRTLLGMLADAAYIHATLACEHGMPAGRQARRALAELKARSKARAQEPSDDAWEAARLGTEAWLALCRRDRALAIEMGREAAQLDRRDPRSLLVLARAHLQRGELGEATRVLEAAQVRAPRAAAPLVGWAEARMEAGEQAGAVEALREALVRSPGHTRALLLLEQALQATGASTTELAPVAVDRAAACNRDARQSPLLAASCTLARAVEARMGRDDRAAVSLAREVAGQDTASTRDRSVATLLIAQLGEVDAAAELAARIPDAGEEQLPLRAWADLALPLGRGEPPPAILPPTPVHPEARLCAARAALAAGGLEQLAGVLAGESLGPGSHPDLRALAAPEPEDETTPVSPIIAYAAGLRALQAGDPPRARRWLARALVGHADGCRAAGAYLPLLALTGRTPGDELEPLRAVNSACIELDWSEAPDPPTAAAPGPPATTP